MVSCSRDSCGCIGSSFMVGGGFIPGRVLGARTEHSHAGALSHIPNVMGKNRVLIDDVSRAEAGKQCRMERGCSGRPGCSTPHAMVGSERPMAALGVVAAASSTVAPPPKRHRPSAALRNDVLQPPRAALHGRRNPPPLLPYLSFPKFSN